ncbi:MAG TPA: LPS export ABC transporter permease LptG [Candidatus Binatia bacterium]|nr:LPS export ABC transporter permease LptG [Candidatus Binatia bacterium]
MKRPVLAVLDRYLLRELAAPFALGLALFTFFLVLDRLYDLTELVITKGVPLPLVFQLLVFMLPSFLGHTLPTALLVAVLLAGGRLAGDLEVTAFKAAGVSLGRLFRPVALAALAVALAAAVFTLVLTPLANQQFQQQLFEILKARAATGLQERVFNTAFGDVIIYVEEISPSQVRLRGLVVSDERDPKVSRIITAREGRLLTDEAGRRITLRLLDGGVNEADVMPASPPPGVATETTAGGAAGPRRYRYTGFAVYDMALTLDTRLGGAARAGKPEKDLTSPELVRRIAALEADPAARRAHEAELHKRLAFPLAAPVFALLGFPLAVRSHRGGRSVALVGTLAIVVAYYLILTALEGLGLRGLAPVWLTIWAPNLLFGGLGAALMAITLREVRAPRLPRLWGALDLVWRRLPRRRLRREERLTTGPRDTTAIIDRYLLRQYAGFIGVGLAVAAALFVVVDLLQTLDRYLRVKPPLAYIAEHFVYALPVALHQALPIVMLVATLVLFLTLTRWHELTALLAAGMSLYRVSAPVLLTGLLVSVAAGVFQEFAVPALNERREEVDRVKIRGQLPRHLRSQTRLWLRASDTRFYRVELLNPATSELYGLTVLDLDADFRLRRRLDARRAVWTPGGWEVSDGARREITADGRVATTPFTRILVALDETIRDFTEVQKPPSAMSYRELREYVGRLQAAGLEVRKYLVDLYAKLSQPLENLVMVLVAIPFALQAPRGGRLYGLALAIALMAAYMVVDYSARAFARADLLPPLLAAWTANVVFLGVGTALFLRART